MKPPSGPMSNTFFCPSTKIPLGGGQITQKQTKRIGGTFYRYSFSIFSTSSRPVNTWAPGCFICYALAAFLKTAINFVCLHFGPFSILSLVFGKGSSQWTRCIGETGNCGRQNCNLGNALGTELGTGLAWELGTGQGTANQWAFQLQCIYALGTPSIKINWPNIWAANGPTPSLKPCSTLRCFGGES